MARKKSNIISGGAATFEIVKRLAEAIEDQGGDRDEGLELIRSDKPFQQAIAKLTCEKLGFIPARFVSTHTVTIDYRFSLEKMIRAGNYDHSDDAFLLDSWKIIKGDPADRRGKKEAQAQIALINFGRRLKKDEIFKGLDKIGLYPANFAGAAALAAKYPHKQQECRFAALGTIWEDPFCGHLVAVFTWRKPDSCVLEPGRRLDLHDLDEIWDDDWYFAAFPKEQPA